MPATKKAICPRDCYANCGLLVTVIDGQATSLCGDPNHPYNHGLVCSKSRGFLDLVYSPARLRAPLLRSNGDFVQVTWDYALELLGEKLIQARSAYGPGSVLHYSDYAHSGVLHNNVSRRFFRAFGGCTRPVGSLCMSAGTAALKAAWGSLATGDLDYLRQAGSIILWGANPAVTNVPLLPYLRRAKKSGARICVIDPMRSETAALADYYLQPRPGSDLQLALGLARCLIESDLVDQQFVCDYTQGFSTFRALVSSVNEKTVETATGLSWETIRSMASSLAGHQPISVIPGFGLQRRANGAQIIWAIACLVALVGSFGLAGGGLYYAHSDWQILGDISGMNDFSYIERSIQRGATGSELLRLGSEIQVAVINQANPLVQNPAPDVVAKSLDQIPFVVVLDQFLTPTARSADLILPTTSFLEDGDLIHNSWHHYLALSQPVIAPRGESRSDPEIFLELASRLGLFATTRKELLDQVIKPLAPYGVTLDSLAEQPWRLPAPGIQWEDKKFRTASGKFHFWDGLTAGFEYPRERLTRNEDFPYILLTPQSAKATHSQGAYSQAGGPLVFHIHPDTAQVCYLGSGQEVVVQTERAEVSGVVQVDAGVHPEVILCYNGLWPSTVSAGLNVLISEKISTVGNQAAMYDCPCMIRGR